MLLGLLFFALPNVILHGQNVRSRTSVQGLLTIGVVQNATEFSESGCKLWLPSERYSAERYIFLSDDEGHAIVNLDGHDTKLKLVRSKEPKGETRKGVRSSYWYKGGVIVFRVDYIVTGVCPADDESCEAVHYDANIVVANRSVKQALTAQGICGS
jgi:hypothetical protein